MVQIILKGKGYIIASICNEEDEGDMVEFAAIQSDIEVFANGKDITKEKGKYVIDNNYIKDNYLVERWEDADYFRLMEKTFRFEFRYNIDIPEEEFDPKKLQLIKTTYELSFLPYGIMQDILYDGDHGNVDDDDDYNMSNFEYGFTSFDIYKEDLSVRK